MAAPTTNTSTRPKKITLHGPTTSDLDEMLGVTSKNAAKTTSEDENPRPSRLQHGISNNTIETKSPTPKSSAGKHKEN